MSLFLSPDELRRATGKRRFKAQCAALDAMGVRYVKAASGEPLVRPDALAHDVAAAEGRPAGSKDWANNDIMEYQADDFELNARPWSVSGVFPGVWYEDNKPAFEMSMQRIADAAVDYPSTFPAIRRDCVYFLFYGADLTYVGLSTGINYRISTHRKQREIPFDCVAYIEVHEFFLATAEMFYIDREQPPYNVRGIR